MELIESNCRFTGGTPSAAACDRDLADLVYRQVVGLPAAEYGDFPDHVYFWNPRRDFSAFLELRRMGELTALGWLRSVMHWNSLPLWRWDDPLPSIANSAAYWRGLFGRIGRKLLG